ncbi:hypothetical protein [Streptomyces morookaense]|uniref:hypothetical protein n=1 Tax=Streptomyces morookaense TaxID=1970 RepID=UPI003F4D2A1F
MSGTDRGIDHPGGGDAPGACDAEGSREVVVYFKADPATVDLVPGFTRDVRKIGHHGTGALEVRLRSEADLERAGDLFRLSYQVA